MDDEYLTAAAGPTSHSPPPIEVAAMIAPGPITLSRLRRAERRRRRQVGDVPARQLAVIGGQRAAPRAPRPRRVLMWSSCGLLESSGPAISCCAPVNGTLTRRLRPGAGCRFMHFELQLDRRSPAAARPAYANGRSTVTLSAGISAGAGSSSHSGPPRSAMRIGIADEFLNRIIGDGRRATTGVSTAIAPAHRPCSSPSAPHTSSPSQAAVRRLEQRVADAGHVPRSREQQRDGPPPAGRARRDGSWASLLARIVS